MDEVEKQLKELPNLQIIKDRIHEVVQVCSRDVLFEFVLHSGPDASLFRCLVTSKEDVRMAKAEKITLLFSRRISALSMVTTSI